MGAHWHQGFALCSIHQTKGHVHTLHFAITYQDETHILDEFGIFKSHQIKGPMTLRCFFPGGRRPLCLECFLRCQPDSGGVASYAWEVAFCLFFLDTLCDNLNWILETQYVFYLCHVMPLQGLWKYCPDVQLCWQSWSSLLWNLHGIKTRLE